MLLEQGALTLPAKKEGKYDACLAMLDDLTNNLYLDIQRTVEAGGVQVEDVVPNPESF